MEKLVSEQIREIISENSTVFHNQLAYSPSTLRIVFMLFVLNVCLDKRVVEIKLFNTTRI